MTNNFELIAHNLTCIFDCLQVCPQYNMMDKDKAYALTGILDVLVYLQKGEIRLPHIDDCVKGAGFGHCIIGTRSAQIRNPFEYPSRTEEDKFVDFVVNIEALLMTVDNTNVDPSQVIEAVISKRDTIKVAIAATRALIKSEGVPPEVASLVREYGSSLAFSELRQWVENYHS